MTFGKRITYFAFSVIKDDSNFYCHNISLNNSFKLVFQDMLLKINIFWPFLSLFSHNYFNIAIIISQTCDSKKGMATFWNIKFLL